MRKLLLDLIVKTPASASGMGQSNAVRYSIKKDILKRIICNIKLCGTFELPLKDNCENNKSLNHHIYSYFEFVRNGNDN